MTSSTPLQPLGELLCELIDHRGRTPKKLGGEFSDSGIIVLSAKNVKSGRIVLDSDIKYVSPGMWEKWMPLKLKVGDVLLTSEAPLGEAVYLLKRADYCLGQRLFGLRGDPDKINPRYLYYALISPSVQVRLQARATGTTAQGIRQSEVVKVLIEVLPKEEQNKIARILGSLDDKIELNRRMNATLEAIAQATFKSWFVDFDPVRAKLEGEEPARMDAETAALFPDELETVDGQEVPKGWMIGKLGDVAENIRRNIQSMDIGADTNYISLAEMPRKSIALDTWVKAGKIDSNKFQFQAGEFLFGKLRPYFRKVGVAPIDGVCSTDILVIVPKNQILNAFTLAQISSSPFIDFVNQSATGTKMPRTNWDTMARYTIVLPSAEVLGAFERAVGPMLKQIQNNIIQSRTLAAIRDTLLPKLISGEIRVPDAMLEAAET